VIFHGLNLFICSFSIWILSRSYWVPAD